MRTYQEQRMEANMEQQAAVARNLRELAKECPEEREQLMRSADLTQRAYEMLEEMAAGVTR